MRHSKTESRPSDQKQERTNRSCRSSHNITHLFSTFKKILWNHWHLIQSIPFLESIFTEPPIIRTQEENCSKTCLSEQTWNSRTRSRPGLSNPSFVGYDNSHTCKFKGVVLCCRILLVEILRTTLRSHNSAQQTSGPLDMSVLSKMTFLGKFIKESARKRPVLSVTTPEYLKCPMTIGGFHAPANVRTRGAEKGWVGQEWGRGWVGWLVGLERLCSQNYGNLPFWS